MLLKDTDDEIQIAVDSLPSSYKQVVLLADVQGFSYKEIAEILEIPDGTVMSGYTEQEQSSKISY